MTTSASSPLSRTGVLPDCYPWPSRLEKRMVRRRSRPGDAGLHAWGVAGALVVTGVKAETVPAGWVERPTPEAMAAFYPPEAAKHGRRGHVVLACAVVADGPPAACKVLKEDPPGQGFGEAAMRLTPSLRFTPRVVDGLQQPGLVTFPVEFRKPSFMKALKSELGLK